MVSMVLSVGDHVSRIELSEVVFKKIDEGRAVDVVDMARSLVRFCMVCKSYGI